MNVILFGPPGAGKGTQCSHIADKYGLYKLSTGDMIRHEISEQTDIGQQVQEIVEAGGLPSSALVNALVVRTIERHSKGSGFVFDGYPRTLGQGQFLDDHLASLGQGIDCAIMLDVNEDQLVGRILARYTCASCGEVYSKSSYNPKVEGVCDKCGGTEFNTRADDTEEVLRTRLKAYHEATEGIIGYYDQQERLIRIDGNRSIGEVTESIDKILDDKQAQLRREVC